ncbi:MAG TPA: hypothetical protein PLI45_05010 [Candidatus Woesebacteria bacterium]|nr:hypothetical protein [Candidatus Woesebacteria bacterium]
MSELNMEIRLSRLILGLLWPCTVDKKVFKNDQEYSLLAAEAKEENNEPKCGAAYFYLRMGYCLKGFEAKNGGWKAVFVPYIQTCRLYDGCKTVNLDSHISEDAVSALIPLLGMETETCMDIPRVEQLPLSHIDSQGYVIEEEEKYWRIADTR